MRDYPLEKVVEDMMYIGLTQAEAISMLCTTDVEDRRKTHRKIMDRISREDKYETGTPS